MTGQPTGKHLALGRLTLATLAYGQVVRIDDEHPDCDTWLAEQMECLWDALEAGCSLADMAKAMREPQRVTARLIDQLRAERCTT